MDIQESHLLLKHSVTQMEEKIHMEGKEFLHRCHRWTWGNMLIQDAFPTLASHEREFLISGYNKEAWDKMAAEYDEVLEEMEKEDG